ncbi:MAG: peptide chain release factor 1 [Pelagibacterales bacterium]|nr:peptide chain release factor 1 [Pelagibacterales bacterium]OUU61589.1 MAG: peptide chain release factor 1 [Alphaproteobacteria bacterium TMED62]|tara:strand:+ start:2434 stop:3507 length:1074 start_codon:yes stop_codon:yes gene_type:complete
MLKNFEHKLSEITELHSKIQNQLSDITISTDDRINLSKKFASLELVLDCKKNIEESEKQLLDNRNLLTNNSDEELLELAKQDIEFLEQELSKLYGNLKKLLIPKDIDDDKNAILEIRAGTGGDEAALFSMVLLKMYQKYSEQKKWKFEILSFSETNIGGCKEAIISFSGRDVFSQLKYESGVHRVQRVPQTETQGRVHTSAATVAVLPMIEEVDIQIDAKDLRVDTFRSQGAGGQHVNTTDSAVRITHLPTNVVASCQEEKSQHKNKAKAMKMLASRLYEKMKTESDEKIANQRKSMVGSGDRSEKIRSYNYPQGRVTDHRINLTLYKLEDIISGIALNEIIEPLLAADLEEKIKSL